MTDVASQREQGLDLWLTFQHHKLVIDVVGTLEVEASLREVLIATHHADLVTDLARCLDIESGLASIVVAGATPSTEPLIPNSQPTDSDPVAATSPDHINVEQAKPDTALLTFLHATASWTPSTRLTMRTHPIFNIAGFHDRAQSLVLSLSATSDLASRLDHKLQPVLHRILDRVPDLPPDLDQALDRDLDDALNPARDLGSYLDRTLDRARDLAGELARDLAGELARDLGSELACTRDLENLPTIDLSYVLDHILNLDYALDANLTQASNYALLSTHDLAHVCVRVRALIRDLGRIHSFADELAQTIQALAHFHQVLSDVTGMDLRSVGLAGIPLQGLRWSAQTQWPPEIENQIWRNSVQIADGIYEVDPGSTTDILTSICE
ncbi:MAG: hypothetical protein M3Y48_00625 [Actinomycetota bacterium]|nr:hypothetical protein [Actinomycetota bacterium]